MAIKLIKWQWYVSALADLQTQFFPTYGLNYFVSNPSNEAKPQAISGRFFAPANLKFAPGVIYKPSAQWTLMYSPVGIKAVIVSDDILKRSGTFFPLDPANLDRSVDFQLGSQLRIDYINKFLNDRIVYGSTLDLYSNYRRNPQNIDVEWFNSLDFIITKNIALSLKSDWFLRR
ncbi:MAG: hypothetical protein HC817_08745 [Saprospiraceae bacterium]|nr:hypothetical protein [Saprospiraceae bacterium]